jgi:hypothetical protein
MAVSQDIGEVRKTAEPVVAGSRLKNNIRPVSNTFTSKSLDSGRFISVAGRGVPE